MILLFILLIYGFTSSKAACRGSRYCPNYWVVSTKDTIQYEVLIGLRLLTQAESLPESLPKLLPDLTTRS
jgi:hypothetical protein